MTLIKYMGTMRRYGYIMNTSPTAYKKDHHFCRKRGDKYQTIRIVHSLRQIDRMTLEDLEGELIARLFVL